MENKIKSFLGTGWGFPPTFDKTLKKVEMISDEADIQSSLEILLSTALGERVMNSGYGCELSKYIFEPIDENLRSLLKKIVKDAIVNHEPRIMADAIELTARPEEGMVEIYIEYTIRGVNSRSNMVFPYYLSEATNLR